MGPASIGWTSVRSERSTPGRMHRSVLVVLLGILTVAHAAAIADAAATPVAAKFQLRGHLPELGERPALRVFDTQAAYDAFRASLGEASVFPPASSLFMTFEREILALYARGSDTGGRCLQLAGHASLDQDTVTLDLQWQAGTCGAPASAHYPFIMVSLARVAADGSSWVQSNRSICASPPGTDTRACAQLGGTAPTASATPTPIASPTLAATATPPGSPTRTPTPSLPSATVTAPPPVVVASPTPAPADGAPNYILIGAVVVIGLLLGAAYLLARSPRRTR